MLTPARRARNAVCELITAYRDARTDSERDEVAKTIALLTPNGGRTLAELAEQALREITEP